VGFSVSYLATSDANQTTFGPTQSFATGGQITVLGGLSTAAGGVLTGPAVFTIAKAGTSVIPS
jgi:phage-related minor tail protein